MDKISLILGLVLILALLTLVFASFLYFKENVTLTSPVPIHSNFKVYVINMAKNVARMNHFAVQYNRSDLAALPFTRFEAVNGSKLGDHMKDLVSPKVWLGMNYLSQMKMRAGEGQLTPGMIGCYLSHYGIFQEIVDLSLPYAVIFEDDTMINPNIYKKAIGPAVTEQVGVYPADWDIVLLGHICKRCERVAGFNNVTRALYFWGTHGYIISQKGAQKMLANREQEITMQIDYFMGFLSQQHAIDIFALHPQVAIAANFGSDIQMMVTRA
jgi:collagen beta-1,O-galactosyltransferase